MRSKPLLAAVPVLLLGAYLVAPADARPSAANTTFAWTYIHQPCTSAYVLDSGASPATVYCTSVAGGRLASVNVPAPRLTARSPQLSLVGIPTFFNLDWDPGSVGAADSLPLTISYPVGSPTDRLVNVRTQLRLRQVPYTGDSSEIRLLTGNLALLTDDSIFLLSATDTGGRMYGYACTPGLAERTNALLEVTGAQGGYEDGCASIMEGLPGPSRNKPELKSPLAGFSTARYPDWTALEMPVFFAFTPYASIYGAGTDRGSPAFQISATTQFQLEARVVFDEQQYRQETTTIDCHWSYKDDYDFIDWTRWPNPIYCRRNVVVTWPTFCTVGGSPSCERYYGNPDNWWVPYVPAFEATEIRTPEGAYGATYDFVSIQSQALLTTP
jgi:hypothetical protein